MSYRGLNRRTGAAIADTEHIRQSIADILLTPVGSRIMRRDYGSLLPELIDQPLHAGTRLRLVSASIMALLRWEPRIQPIRVSLVAGDDHGAVYLNLEAVATTGPRTGHSINFTVPMRGAS